MKKMSELKQKLRQQQALSHPIADEAAGLKRRINYNCLSCDKPVAVDQCGQVYPLQCIPHFSLNEDISLLQQ